MRKLLFGTFMICALVGAIGVAQAATVMVNSDITTSTTWTSNNVYNLQKQIYVKNGATLTIEAGTLIASTTNLGGSLAVTRGSQINVQGTMDNPVIMTSEDDVATWTGGDPKTGTWREACTEWGNLTLMGQGYISENATVGNVPYPDPNNVAQMEGLVAAFPGDPDVLYGGGNDDDDSGSISYLSLRYGGKVIALTVELNGLSLGGIGRETDMHHIEIMNNVDDGIEIWGGCVELKYCSIWNIGDDSFDIDQGWRGKAQNIFIVQGYSADDSQGSGVGDNGFEHDGAEDSDWQPVTTTQIYNATFIGQPVDGDGATAWRDNARVQYRNCIFMDCGEKVVRFDNVDGDGANGYGHNGTLSWPDTWTTDWNAVPPHANDPANPGDFYKVQVYGKLAHMINSVYFRNQNSAAYTEANARGVFDPANNNVLIPGFDPADQPIVDIQRDAPVTKGGKTMLPVNYIDPRPANEALWALDGAPDDGFYTPNLYRGAFAPGDNWLYGWTAAYAYGMAPQDKTSLSSDIGALPETGGVANMTLDAGAANAGRTYLLVPGVTGTAPGTPLPGGFATLPLNWDFVSDLVLLYNNVFFFFDFFGTLDANGQASAQFQWPGYPGSNGLKFYFAFCCNGPFDYVSNPVEILITNEY